MKRCNGCHHDLPLDQFSRDTSRADGVQRRCKKCRAAMKAVNLAAHPERTRELQRLANARHNHKTAPLRAAHRITREERQAARKSLLVFAQLFFREAQSWIACVGCGTYMQRLAATHQYCRGCFKAARAAKAREHWRTPKVRESQRLRYRQDQKYNLNKKFKAAVRRGLVEGHASASFADVGYTPEELKTRLLATMPSGYTWDDFLSGELHIDHIRPIASFGFTSKSDPSFCECWALENLQLLPAAINLAKSDKLDFCAI